MSIISGRSYVKQQMKAKSKNKDREEQKDDRKIKMKD